ncbi:hypothetical protein BATDEDRAFT_19558 [Batrachochytrium dendrobatidis JAM81]|uniref:Nudix hydrolase domain-containing protein n=2 Tax=Batrachochytrium dendrobatidis TaxID=109871 RepID=F4P3Q7_BATDJ|nr:uncharacterized protein BATDEDRAFT_19558 [Batrachochytrium dendrobatidis JAM81]EGF80123.1 hypothetical protein BATDEDRAFT_19558 [Batrachochytrium dendrobatidis JAM81]KAK5666608.1 hypothetical protein QVD99_006678 [Batrachochytrium dendrobatidis]OAJ41253.1 hypothetical protein BDEG_24885 [Batrachochytrium dendrobatidis JEL423]|eukprot:XP_006678908.1 hypothetical protein BATDEDRAFT_19558 [Batrachochytrium dendrobatidis JAM81]
MFIQLGKWRVPLTAKYEALRPQLTLVQAFKPFQEWVQRLGHQLDTTSTGKQLVVHGVQITDVDYFGKGRIGFVKFHADIRWADHADGVPVPGIVFCRGGAVAILLIVRPIESESEPTREPQEWAVLTVQPRLPIGLLQETALPAGMLDGDSNFSGVAAKELQEECGITLASSDLIDLTNYKLLDDDACASDCSVDRVEDGLYPSAGGCDEQIRLFLCEKQMPMEQIQALQGREAGLRSEGERIQVRLVPLQDLWRSTRDMKALAALALYQQQRKHEL